MAPILNFIFMAPQSSVHVAFIYSCEDTGCSLAVVLLCLEDEISFFFLFYANCFSFF